MGKFSYINSQKQKFGSKGFSQHTNVAALLLDKEKKIILQYKESKKALNFPMIVRPGATEVLPGLLDSIVVKDKKELLNAVNKLYNEFDSLPDEVKNKAGRLLLNIQEVKENKVYGVLYPSKPFNYNYTYSNTKDGVVSGKGKTSTVPVSLEFLNMFPVSLELDLMPPLEFEAGMRYNEVDIFQFREFITDDYFIIPRDKSKEIENIDKVKMPAKFKEDLNNTDVWDWIDKQKAKGIILPKGVSLGSHIAMMIRSKGKIPFEYGKENQNSNMKIKVNKVPLYASLPVFYINQDLLEVIKDGKEGLLKNEINIGIIEWSKIVSIWGLITSFGEFRHQTNKSTEPIYQDYSEIARCDAYKKGFKLFYFKQDYFLNLLKEIVLPSFRNGFWHKAYGGNKWGDVLETALKSWKALLNGYIEDFVSYSNILENLEHNNAIFFNKINCFQDNKIYSNGSFCHFSQIVKILDEYKDLMEGK